LWVLHPILQILVKVAVASLVILPIWFLVYLFRPPGQRRSE
jgi:hypothetical protein